MHPALDRLLDVLVPRRTGDAEYEAASLQEMGSRLFGGQVLAQALAAASLEAEGTPAHSLHAYFLRRGTPAAPIRLRVAELRHSRAFRTFEVTALQQEPILQMTASFHVPEAGLAHQIPMDEVGPPGGETYEASLLRAIRPEGLPESGDAFELAVEIRAVDGLALFTNEVKPPSARCWMRSRSALPDDPMLHQCLFAYGSDYAIMAGAVHAHPVSAIAMMTASLDHAMWFHRPFRFDEWTLFEIDSPVTWGARGLGRGLLYTADGTLVASCTQESLMRPLPGSSPE